MEVLSMLRILSMEIFGQVWKMNFISGEGSFFRKSLKRLKIIAKVLLVEL
tara:strand:+ start:425 stop:574 length:150 start_codon:yes stop_codon:yes gene_type:complete